MREPANEKFVQASFNVLFGNTKKPEKDYDQEEMVDFGGMMGGIGGMGNMMDMMAQLKPPDKDSWDEGDVVVELFGV